MCVLMAVSNFAMSDENSLLGSWDFSIPTPFGIDLVKVEVNGETGDYQGTLDGELGKSDMSNLKIEGSMFSFEQEVEKLFMSATLKFKGQVNGNKLKGSIDSPMGLKEFSGVRK